MLGKVSLKAKLILGVAASCLLLTTISLITWSSLSRVDASLVKVTDLSVPKLSELSDMRYFGSEVTRLFLRVSTKGLGESEVTRLKGKLEDHVNLYEASEKIYLGHPFEPGEEELYKDQNAKWQAALILIREGADLVGKDDEASTQRLDLLNASAVAKAKVAHNEAFQKLHNFQSQVSGQLRSDAVANSNFSMWLVFTCCAIGVLLNIIVGWIFAQQLSKTLEAIGNRLGEEASDVAAAAQQISGTSEDLSTGATQQAASLEETAASMHEIAAMVHNSTTSARHSEAVARESYQAAMEGKEVMVQLLGAIQDIDVSNQKIMEEVGRSNQQLGEIVNIIETIQDKTRIINDIVFQTKLLSFNASVEAARAGEQGKGFSVVAEEVGKLAQMSGAASREISELLAASVVRVRSTVNQTQQGVGQLITSGSEKIRAGVSIADRGNTVLENIVTNVGMMQGHIKEIVDAADQQSKGVQEINSAVQQLDTVTQSNASAANASAVSSKALEDRAQQLHGLVRQLRIIVSGQKTDESAEHAQDKVA